MHCMVVWNAVVHVLEGLNIFKVKINLLSVVLNFEIPSKKK